MRISSFVAAVLAVAFLTPVHAQKKPITLGDLPGNGASAGATDIQWRPDSKGFSYKKGSRYHYFDIEAKKSRELPDCTGLCMSAAAVPEPPAFEWKNRGVREQTTQWCSDNRHLLMKAGGDLLWMDTDENAATPIRVLTRTLYDEADPKLSPDCKYVGFRKDYDLYSLQIETGAIHAITKGGNAERMNARLDWVYPEELQIPSAYWWAPDSRRLAYLQFDMATVPVYPHADYLAIPPRAEPERYPKPGEPNAGVRLAIVDRAEAKARFVALGDPRDYLIARVNWLPDGKRLAVQRLNRIQNELTLFFVNAETLETEEILTEKDEHWVNLSDDFTFLPSLDAFLWTAENTGYRHLYLYFLKDRYAKQLTKGDWEVSSVLGVDAAEKTVYFQGTEKSPLERHVYSLKLDGGQPQRITGDEGTWDANYSPNGAWWVGRHSSITRPAGQDVYTASGAKHAMLVERDTTVPDRFEVLPTEYHTVKLDDGTVLYGRLIRPAGFRAGRKYPVIVQVYGGPHAQNVRNSWAGANLDQVYAHLGFVVWQVDNRGTSGRGHVFETPVARKLGVVELEDQLKGVEYLKKLGFVDEKRIGVNGWSYGGFMTLNCLLNAPDVFAAGISGAPVVDWRFYDTIYTERYMDVPEHNAEGYSLSSLLPNAGNLKGKLLLVHNLWDDNVHFQNALHMADRLQKAGKQFQMMIYPQKTHGVTGEAAKHMRQMMVDFFVRELEPGKVVNGVTSSRGGTRRQ
jgi:dipeptidyl-peptidase-4